MVKQYLEHSRKILTSDYSWVKGGSKGMGLISLFGHQNEYNLQESFPLLTTKSISINSIIHELIWFMRGETNIKYLVDNNVHIWDGNAFDHNLEKMAEEGIFPKEMARYSLDWEKTKKEYFQRIKTDEEFAQRWGDLGPVYGAQWRHWKVRDENGKVREIDQLVDLFENIKKNPTSKKLIVNSWNVADIPKMALEPCHMFFQVNYREGAMDLQLYQRSCDMFLGVPFNIASYSMLTQIIAQQAGFKPGRFIHTFGDAHFYTGAGERAKWYEDNFCELKTKVIQSSSSEDYLKILDWLNQSLPAESFETEGQDHVGAIIEQLSRTPKPLPRMEIAYKPFDKLTFEDFKLTHYNPEPAIKRAMAI